MTTKQTTRNIFELNDTLTSSHGYLYGRCARMLHYANETKELRRTEDEIKLMNWGKKVHAITEWRLQQEYPNWNLKAELKFSRQLPHEIYGISKVKVMPDLAGDKFVVEIKPRYSMRAYIQTLVQKYVLPTHSFKLYEYSTKQLFPIKANLQMAEVYLGRILTALKYLPPRIPYADKKNNKVCINCPFNERCFSEPSGTWEEFKLQSQFAVDGIRND